jgi:phage-related minor tail protein
MELLQSQSNFVGAFEDGLASFIDGTKSAKDAFKDFVRSVEQQLSRLASQDIANAIFGGKGGGGSSGLFSFLSSLALVLVVLRRRRAR